MISISINIQSTLADNNGDRSFLFNYYLLKLLSPSKLSHTSSYYIKFCCIKQELWGRKVLVLKLLNTLPSNPHALACGM